MSVHETHSVRDERAVLAYEAALREAGNRHELERLIVDDAPRLVGCLNAFLFRRDRRGRRRMILATGLSAVEPQAPAVRETEALAADLPPQIGRTHVNGRDALGFALVDRQERELAFVVLVGAGWFDAGQRRMAARLRTVWSHALLSFGARPARPAWPRAIRLCLAGALLGALAWPVPLVALAPYEIVARDPAILASTMDGAVAEIVVPDNAHVKAGTVIATLEQGELRSGLDVAERRLELALAQLRGAEQARFAHGRDRPDIDTATAEHAVATAERDRHRSRLDRSVLRAPQGGIVLHGGREEWRGRPVRAGERIAAIASPDRIEARLELAVADAVVLSKGATASLFPDADPLGSLSARVTRVSYLPQTTGDGRLIYTLRASVEGRPRIGQRGVARVTGESVPLALWLMRRPVTWLRQTFGW